MTKLYKVKDITDKVKDTELYGHVANKLQNDLTTRFAVLRNFSDEKNDTIPTERMEIKNISSGVESELFYTNELTLSCWIYLTGESEASCGVMTNGDNTNRCGLLINANEETGDDSESGPIGYTWENKLEQNSDGDGVWSIQDFTFGIGLPKQKWTHLVIMIYPSGKARLFIDNIYRASFDEGIVRDKVSFSKIELGRFNGYADNIMCFSTTLDYGNVDIDQEAVSDFATLYYTSRTEPKKAIVETPIVPKKQTADNIPFFYMQSDEYIEAATLYDENTRKKIESGMTRKEAIDSQTQEELMVQKYAIEGGVNDKTRVYADNEFMTFPGELKKL
jgi:hypothetical protein